MSSETSSSPASSSLIANLKIPARELIALIALIQALQALAIDAMLPALGDIARDLHVSNPNHRQLVVGVFLLGCGLGSLVPGALADRYGRRRVLMFCLGANVVLTAACVFAPEFNTLIALRLLQGVVCSGLTVVPMAIIRDLFQGDRMAKLQSLVGMIFMVVPMLAPSIGQIILAFTDWHGIFAFMTIYAAGIALWAWARLPETLRPEFRQTVRPADILRNFGTVLRTRESIGYVLASSILMGVLWGYIQSSQQLVAEHFGAGSRFPVIFGALALAMAFANFGNSRIVERFGARRVSHSALIAYIVMALIHFALAHSGQETLWQFVIAMGLTQTLMGFTGTNFGSIALQPFARIAGSASSVQAFIRMILASLIGGSVGLSFDQTAKPFSHALVLGGASALVLVLYSERGKLFRRLLPPGTPRPLA